MTQSGYYLTDEPHEEPEELAAMDEPPIGAPCDCCNGNGHSGVCLTAVDLSMARLSALLGRPLPAGFIGGSMTAWDIDHNADEPTLSCVRCFDTGVTGDQEPMA